MSAVKQPRLLLVPKSPKLLSIAHKTGVSGRVRKNISNVTIPLNRELSPEQLEQAQQLANIIPGRQRPDRELLKVMRTRRGLLTHSVLEQPSVSTPFTLRSVPPSTPQFLAPPRIKKALNWEQEALARIKKNGLSLNLEWSRKTWINKANNIDRLKLLKDDGYDIVPLQAKGTTANQIVQAVLDHIEVRKRQAALRKSSLSGWKEDIMPQHLGEQHKGKFTPKTKPLFPHSRPCLQNPLPLTPRKRKHDLAEDYVQEVADQDREHQIQEISSHRCITSSSSMRGPVHKKLRLLTTKKLEMAVEADAFGLFKKNVARDIFRSSLATHNALRSKTAATASHIIFTTKESSINSGAESHVLIGSQGLSHIFDEMKWLSEGQDDNGTMYIRNPFTIEDQDVDTEMQ